MRKWQIELAAFVVFIAILVWIAAICDDADPGGQILCVTSTVTWHPGYVEVTGVRLAETDTLVIPRMLPTIQRFPTPEELRQLRAASQESATRAATELDDWMQDKRGER